MWNEVVGVGGGGRGRRSDRGPRSRGGSGSDDSNLQVRTPFRRLLVHTHTPWAVGLGLGLGSGFALLDISFPLRRSCRRYVSSCCTCGGVGSKNPPKQAHARTCASSSYARAIPLIYIYTCIDGVQPCSSYGQLRPNYVPPEKRERKRKIRICPNYDARLPCLHKLNRGAVHRRQWAKYRRMGTSYAVIIASLPLLLLE